MSLSSKSTRRNLGNQSVISELFSFNWGQHPHLIRETMISKKIHRCIMNSGVYFYQIISSASTYALNLFTNAYREWLLVKAILHLQYFYKTYVPWQIELTRHSTPFKGKHRILLTKSIHLIGYTQKYSNQINYMKVFSLQVIDICNMKHYINTHLPFHVL